MGTSDCAADLLVELAEENQIRNDILILEESESLEDAIRKMKSQIGE